MRSRIGRYAMPVNARSREDAKTPVMGSIGLPLAVIDEMAEAVGPHPECGPCCEYSPSPETIDEWDCLHRAYDAQFSAGFHTQEWLDARDAATDRFRKSAREYARRNGLEAYEAVTAEEWRRQRDEAIARERDSRRRAWRDEGDAAIIGAIGSAVAAGACESGFPMTAARGSILRAIMSIASGSAMLYASMQTIADKAHVSRRSACRHVRALEEAGVLVRKRSGGLRLADGARRTNAYALSHQRLRELLGIDCKRPSWYVSPGSPAMQAAVSSARLGRKVRPWGSPRFNGSGFARQRASARTGRPASRRHGLLSVRERLSALISIAPGEPHVGTVKSPKGAKKRILKGFASERAPRFTGKALSGEGRGANLSPAAPAGAPMPATAPPQTPTGLSPRAISIFSAFDAAGRAFLVERADRQGAALGVDPGSYLEQLLDAFASGYAPSWLPPLREAFFRGGCIPPLPSPA
jgi:biotin operon repressor